jgi:hypothetical protein
MRCSINEVTDRLREFEQLRHRCIPCYLVLSCSKFRVVARPSYASLEARDQASYRGQEILEILSANSNIKELVVSLTKDDHGNHLSNLLSSVLWGNASGVVRFAIEIYCMPEYHQMAFERLSATLCRSAGSKRNISASYLRFKENMVYSDRPPVIRSNGCWDSLVSPGLVLNWFYHQQHERKTLQNSMHPLQHQPTSTIMKACVIGPAVRAISQGVPYSNATNLIPCDLSTSNTSIIFQMLRQHVRLF